jgi:hypothetical protein
VSGLYGTFVNVRSLIKAIKDYFYTHIQLPQAFVWTATLEKIVGKIAKCKEALGTLQYHLGEHLRSTNVVGTSTHKPNNLSFLI